MDTVVSSTNGTGGLLVLVDRRSRRYVIEKLAHVTQDEVVAALKRMIARKALGRVLPITTDNGCEFLDPEKIKAVVGCNVYYTRAYASLEKDSFHLQFSSSAAICKLQIVYAAGMRPHGRSRRTAGTAERPSSDNFHFRRARCSGRSAVAQ